jgi:hypothetical protein
MNNIEIDLAADADSTMVQCAVETAFSSAGLRCTMKDTLRKYPGCIHWHYKNGNRPGTLAVMYWPGQCRAWFSIQASRNAAWIEEIVQVLRKSVTAHMRAGRDRE